MQLFAVVNLGAVLSLENDSRHVSKKAQHQKNAFGNKWITSGYSLNWVSAFLLPGWC